jgi:hypothetical protein
LDAQGRPDLNVMQDSLSQIKNLVYPLLSKQLSNMTIARIAGSNETYDWSVENLLISIPDLIPEYFELRTKNLLQVNLKELETEKNNTKVTMEIKNLRPVFKDMKFWYLRKTFPKIEDFGNVDIDLSKGKGAKIKIIWKIKSKSNRPFAFALLEVKCIIDSMDVTVKDAKHEILDRIATSVFAANLKQSVAQGIVNAIVDSLRPMNDQMNSWFASRPIESLYERANEQIHQVYQQTNRLIKDHPIDKAMDKAREIVSDIKETASEKIEVAKEYIGEKTAEVSQAVKEEVQKLEQKAEGEWTHAWQSKPHKKRHYKKKASKGPIQLESEQEFPSLIATTVTPTKIEKVGELPSHLPKADLQKYPAK